MRNYAQEAKCFHISEKFPFFMTSFYCHFNPFYTHAKLKQAYPHTCLAFTVCSFCPLIFLLQSLIRKQGRWLVIRIWIRNVGGDGRRRNYWNMQVVSLSTKDDWGLAKDYLIIYIPHYRLRTFISVWKQKASFSITFKNSSYKIIVCPTLQNWNFWKFWR